MHSMPLAKITLAEGVDVWAWSLVKGLGCRLQVRPQGHSGCAANPPWLERNVELRVWIKVCGGSVPDT